MILSLNISSPSSMNFTSTGRTSNLCLTSSDSPLTFRSRAASFSVVSITRLSSGIAAKVLFIFSMSRGEKA